MVDVIRANCDDAPYIYQTIRPSAFWTFWCKSARGIGCQIGISFSVLTYPTTSLKGSSQNQRGMAKRPRDYATDRQ
jgi:hypothetical protein